MFQEPGEGGTDKLHKYAEALGPNLRPTVPRCQSVLCSNSKVTEWKILSKEVSGVDQEGCARMRPTKRDEGHKAVEAFPVPLSPEEISHVECLLDKYLPQETHNLFSIAKTQQ